MQKLTIQFREPVSYCFLRELAILSKHDTIKLLSDNLAKWLVYVCKLNLKKVEIL